MRNHAIESNSCRSFHPGHRTNPRAMRSMALRPTLWSPADVEIATSLSEGLLLFVYSGGGRRQMYAHNLAEIAHSLRVAPRRPEGVSLGRVNFLNSVLALPADPRIGAGLAYFSVSSEPLAPCIFERDEDLARDFDALTAALQRS